MQLIAEVDVPQIPLYYSPLVYGVARHLQGFWVPLGKCALRDVHH